jgi:hypothetical protein
LMVPERLAPAKAGASCCLRRRAAPTRCGFIRPCCPVSSPPWP